MGFIPGCSHDADHFFQHLEGVVGQDDAAGGPAALGANGLLMLPYMSGERTPIFYPQTRGVIAGLSLSHTRGEIYSTLLEGTAFAIHRNLEAMQKNGAYIHQGVAVGGGSANDLWLQTVCDVTGMPQYIPQKTIGTSYGNAYLAGLISGTIKSVDLLKEQWARSPRKFSPTPSIKRLTTSFMKCSRNST